MILIFALFIFNYNSFDFIKLFSYLILKHNSYERTEIGEEINKNIEGLKNFIKDFSILSEREQEELTIWDDYLIYSVLFNQNDKIISQLSSLVEAEFETGKVYFEPIDNNSYSNYH